MKSNHYFWPHKGGGGGGGGGKGGGGKIDPQMHIAFFIGQVQYGHLLVPGEV